jgi:flagellin-like protein
MQFDTLLTDDDAVSEVVGVILMVAITVLLAATAATFLLGITDSKMTPAPTASFDFDYEDSASNHDDKLLITHTGGQTIDSTNLYVSVTDAQTTSTGDLDERYDANADLDAEDEFSAGHSVNVSQESTGHSALSLDPATVTVSWESPNSDQSFVLAKWSN